MIYIIGTGTMGQAYAQVLKKLKQAVIVVGRGAESAEQFELITNIKPIAGGIELFLEARNFTADESVIIATGTEALMPTLKLVLKAGAKKVLIEKPAALSIEELLRHADWLAPYAEYVYVAYNRRFYASVLEAKKLIAEDGGLENLHFEFTEWAHKIEPLEKAAGVKENWFFANSTHVVDLAFFLAGKPLRWKTFAQSGSLKWHKTTRFVGSGITENGVLFSYNSNWESAGRWSIELFTSKRRIYLKPLEGIEQQWKGSIALEKLAIEDGLDQTFKPGLYRQIEAFLHDPKALKTLAEQIQDAELYREIVEPK